MSEAGGESERERENFKKCPYRIYVVSLSDGSYNKRDNHFFLILRILNVKLRNYKIKDT